MMEFITIVAAIVVAMLILSAISMALVFNKRFMMWMTKKYMKLFTETLEEMEDEEI